MDGSGQRLRRRVWILASAWIAAALLLSGLSGCGSREDAGIAPAPAEQAKPEAPGVAALLQLMPESAVTAMATPSLRNLDDHLETFLLRASPGNINMEAEIRVVIQQAGQMLGVVDARSLDDIALDTGVDLDMPAAVFIGLPGKGKDMTGAVVFHGADMDKAEKTILRVFGDAPMVEETPPGVGVTLHELAGGTAGYLIKDSLLAVAFDTAVLREVAQRLKAPVHVRYGNPPFPADPADDLVQLTRLDRVMKGAAAESAPAGGPEPTRKSLDKTLADASASFAGDDPLVTVWRVGETTLEAVSRLDLSTHPKAAGWVGAPHALRHLGLLPKDTHAVVSLTLGTSLREALTNLAQSAALPESPAAATAPISGLPQALGQLVPILGDSLTLSASGGSGDPAALTFLIEFQDGDEARTTLRQKGLAPVLSETYNNVEIYLLPVPLPLGDGVHYAVAANTLVLSTRVDHLKTVIDFIRSGSDSSWAKTQTPALDPGEPRLGFLDLKRDFLTVTLMPNLTAQGAVSSDHAQAAGRAWEKFEELRVTARVEDNCLQSRLQVRVQ